MIKFECNGCSGCCHGGISITLKEAISKYYRYFPLIGIFSVSDIRNIPIEKDKDSYSKRMKEFSGKNLSFYTKTSDNRKIVVHPQIVSLNHPELPCMNLGEGNLCSIYSFKPYACSLYPVRIDTPISQMEKGLLREKQRSFDEDAFIPCEGWTGIENVIFTDKGPTDEGIIDIFNKRVVESKVTTSMMKSYFDEIKKSKEIEDKVLAYSELNTESENVIQISVVNLIEYLTRNGLVSPLYIGSFVNGQIKVYEKLIDSLSNRNNKKFNLILNIAKNNLKDLRSFKKEEV